MKIPTQAAHAATSIVNDARIIDRALTGWTTVEGLEHALAAIQRIRSRGAETALMIRRLRSEAMNTRREESRRRERLLPTPPVCPAYGADELGIPGRAG